MSGFDVLDVFLNAMKFATLTVSTLIVIAVLIPGSNIPDVDILGIDKLVHFIMFVCWTVAVRYDFNQKVFRYWLAFLCGVFFSLATEIVQILVEGRTFDPYDVVADLVGIIVGLMIGGWIVRIVNRESRIENRESRIENRE
jgi:VanZ family protein